MPNRIQSLITHISIIHNPPKGKKKSIRIPERIFQRQP